MKYMLSIEKNMEENERFKNDLNEMKKMSNSKEKENITKRKPYITFVRRETRMMIQINSLLNVTWFKNKKKKKIFFQNINKIYFSFFYYIRYLTILKNN